MILMSHHKNTHPGSASVSLNKKNFVSIAQTIALTPGFRLSIQKFVLLELKSNSNRRSRRPNLQHSEGKLNYNYLAEEVRFSFICGAISPPDRTVIARRRVLL